MVPERPRSRTDAHAHPSSATGRAISSDARALVYFERTARRRTRQRHPPATRHTPSCRGQPLDVLSRREYDQSPRTTRQRSCGASKQPIVSSRAQVPRVGKAAAHRVPRRCPANAAPPSLALKDRGDAKKRGLRRWGCTDLGPDTPAGQNFSTMAVGKGTSRGFKAQDRGIRARGSHLYQSQPTALRTGTRWR